jgi:heme exporter protein CcmD
MMHVLAMGKYAAYVWPAYGASALGIALAIVITLRAYARAKKLLADAQAQQTRP